MYKPILKRAGIVLIVVGILDIAVRSSFMSKEIAVALDFNIIFIAVGIFLLHGSLRTASVVHWISVFSFSLILSFIFAWPLIRPFDLILTQLKLYTNAFMLNMTLILFILSLLFWLIRQLEKKEIQEARMRNRLKQLIVFKPMIMAMLFVTIVSLIDFGIQNNEFSKRAKIIAEQKVGSGYKLHFNIFPIQFLSDSGGIHIYQEVVAWDNHVVRYIPVEWNEK